MAVLKSCLFYRIMFCPLQGQSDIPGAKSQFRVGLYKRQFIAFKAL